MKNASLTPLIHQHERRSHVCRCFNDEFGIFYVYFPRSRLFWEPSSPSKREHISGESNELRSAYSMSDVDQRQTKDAFYRRICHNALDRAVSRFHEFCMVYEFEEKGSNSQKREGIQSPINILSLLSAACVIVHKRNDIGTTAENEKQHRNFFSYVFFLSRNEPCCNKLIELSLTLCWSSLEQEFLFRVFVPFLWDSFFLFTETKSRTLGCCLFSNI